jgi:gas vesicle protein
MRSNNDYGYFLLGLSTGAAIALLLAPKSGTETRNYLQSSAESAAQQLKDQSEQVIGRATEVIDRGQAMLRDQVDKLSTAIDAGKQAYHDSVKT